MLIFFIHFTFVQVIEFSQLQEGAGDVGSASYRAPPGMSSGAPTGVAGASLHSPQPSPAKPGMYNVILRF